MTAAPTRKHAFSVHGSRPPSTFDFLQTLRSPPDFLSFDLVDARKTLKNLPFREYPVFVNYVKPEVLLFFPVSLEHSAPVTRSNESGVA